MDNFRGVANMDNFPAGGNVKDSWSSVSTVRVVVNVECLARSS